MRTTIIAALAAVAFGGCTCPEPYAAFSGDFEYCEGTCDWWPSGEGSAERVTTIHPGEHGVRLDGPVTIAAAASVGITGAYAGDKWLELVTTCEGPIDARLVAVGVDQWELALRLPAGPADDSGARTYHPLYVPTPARPPSLYDPYCNPSTTQCCNPTVDWGCYNDAYDGSVSYTIAAVSVQNTSGVCTVDQIRIMSQSECYY